MREVAERATKFSALIKLMRKFHETHEPGDVFTVDHADVGLMLEGFRALMNCASQSPGVQVLQQDTRMQ